MLLKSTVRFQFKPFKSNHPHYLNKIMISSTFSAYTKNTSL